MNRPLISDVVAVVAEWFSLSADDLTGPNRRHHMVWPRWLAMHLARKMTGQSLTGIGRVFGGRDHSTVRHACLSIAHELRDNPDLATAVRPLIRAIHQRASTRFDVRAVLREHVLSRAAQGRVHG